MMRRFRVFSVLVLVLAVPLVASAGSPEADPNGLVSYAPTVTEWLDSIVRVLVVFLGI